jgi:hypothetical protein
MLLGVDGPILPENGPCNENFGELGLAGDFDSRDYHAANYLAPRKLNFFN